MTTYQAAPRGRIFQSLGAILTGLHSRAPVPVRGQSRLAGTCEHEMWAPSTRREVQQILLAARRFEVAGRARGQRNGPLGSVGLEVLDLMVNIIHFKSGRLEPSLRYLMAKLKRSKDAIVRALAALREHGFIDWMRRFVSADRAGRGPQIRQTSNAYRLALPSLAAQLLTRWIGRPAMPEDVLSAELARKSAYQVHLADLSCTEYLSTIAGASAPPPASHAPAQSALADFARCMKILAQNQDAKRESAQRSEYQSHSYPMAKI